jgi:ubiquitin-like 1-activating enzyme E1 B
VSNDVGVLYDPDETDNLVKKLTDLGTASKYSFAHCIKTNISAGIKGGSFLTITDEDDEDTLVNVVIVIQDGYEFNEQQKT